MQTKKCNFCGEEIRIDALKCRYCREWLVEGRDKSIEERIRDIMKTTQTIRTPRQGTPAAPTYYTVQQPNVQERKPSYETPVAPPVQSIPVQQIELPMPVAEPQAEVNHSKYMPQQVAEMPVSAPVIAQRVHTEVEQPQVVEQEPIALPQAQPEEIVTVEIEPLYSPQSPIEAEPLYRSQPQALHEPIQLVKLDRVEEEIETDPEPQLRQQHFETNKILANIFMVLLILEVFVAYLIPKGATLPLYMYVIPATTAVLGVYLLYELYRYLQNFAIFDSVSNYIKVVFVCVAICAGGAIATLMTHNQTILLGAVALPFGIAYLASLMVGWKLWKESDDYVDGLESFGLVLFVAVFLPPVWIAVPYFLYKVFNNASYYAETYGYSDEY